MRELWILIKLQLSSLFGINQILHMKNAEDKKQGKRALGALMVMLFALGYFSVLYSILMAEGFAQIGMLPTPEVIQLVNSGRVWVLEPSGCR